MALLTQRVSRFVHTWKGCGKNWQDAPHRLVFVVVILEPQKPWTVVEQIEKDRHSW
jgi:hypothetical protein